MYGFEIGSQTIKYGATKCFNAPSVWNNTLNIMTYDKMYTKIMLACHGEDC